MTDPQSSQSPSALARKVFSDEGLPFPPLPPGLDSQMQQIEDHVFATEVPKVRPYDVFGCAEAILSAKADKTFALVGFDGHGVNSWAVHYYLVQPGLALFLQLPWGGIYMDQDAGRSAVEKAFQWAASSQERIGAALDSGDLSDRRLIIIASLFQGSAWAVGSSSDENAPLDWTEIDGALEEFDEALAALFGHAPSPRSTLNDERGRDSAASGP